MVVSRRWPGKAVEIACWVAGTAMVTLYFGARTVGEIERKQGIDAFAQAQSAGTLTPPHFVTPDPFEWQDVELPASSAVFTTASFSQDSANFPADSGASSVDSPVDSPVDSSMELPAAWDSMPIALLSIARVGLQVPVFADTSERNLNRGAGWVEGTAAPDEDGNIAIAAHRDGYFRVLKDVALGDVLVLESIARERNYRVTEISIVDPDDTSSLFATDAAVVTLVTCYPFYFVGHAPQRYIVRAVAL